MIAEVLTAPSAVSNRQWMKAARHRRKIFSILWKLSFLCRVWFLLVVLWLGRSNRWTMHLCERASGAMHLGVLRGRTRQVKSTRTIDTGCYTVCVMACFEMASHAPTANGQLLICEDLHQPELTDIDRPVANLY
jgi:hypothetical protein